MNTTDIADQSLYLVADIKQKILLTKGVGNPKRPLVSNLKVVMRRCDVMGVCRGRDRGRVRACPPTPLSSVTCRGGSIPQESRFTIPLFEESIHYPVLVLAQFPIPGTGNPGSQFLFLRNRATSIADRLT